MVAARALSLAVSVGVAVYTADVVKNLVRRCKKGAGNDLDKGGTVFVVTTAALPWRTGNTG